MLKFGLTGRIFLVLLIAAMVTAFMPDTAHATTTTIKPVEDMANTLLGFLTGPLATAAGAIAIAFVGYRWFSGRMELGRAVATVAGIVLVIGSVQIVDFLRGGSGSTKAGTVKFGWVAPAPTTALNDIQLFSEQV